MGSIKDEARKWRNADKHPAELTRKIDRKYVYLKNSYGIRFDPIAQSLRSYPGLYSQHREIPNLELFFRSPVEIAMSLNAIDGQLFCAKSGSSVPIVRFRDRILVDNPLTGRKESWSRLSSDTKSRHPVHHSSSRGRDKSLFYGNYDYIEPLELDVFHMGRGLLMTENKIQLYAEFESPIGESQRGVSQSFMCLVLDRKPRPPVKKNKREPIKTGYLSCMHGYPMGPSDLKDDLAGTGLRANRIPIIKNPM